MNRNKAVDIAIAAGWMTEGSEFESGMSRIFSSPCCSHRFWGSLSPYPMGTGGCFARVKRLGREVNRSLPTSAEVKKT
jgi:hypothetical protein